jgi:hypothetical protein
MSFQNIGGIANWRGWDASKATDLGARVVFMGGRRTARALVALLGKTFSLSPKLQRAEVFFTFFLQIFTRRPTLPAANVFQKFSRAVFAKFRNALGRFRRNNMTQTAAPAQPK